MTAKYKIKGRGDTREVYDGDTLVGRLERLWSTETVYSFAKDTILQEQVGVWLASWPDGTPVFHAGGGRIPPARMIKHTMSHWSWHVTWNKDAMPLKDTQELINKRERK